MSSPPRTPLAGGGADPAALQATIDALRAENAELRLQVARLSSAAPDADASTEGGGGGGFHSRTFSNLSETTSQSAAAANATVRRKKDAMDTEMGRAYRAPHVSSFRNLFNRSDVLHFEEDSPSFRLKMDELEESVDELRVFAQQLVDSCRRYCKHGHAAVEAGREFSGLLTSLRSEAWTQRFGRVAALLAAFGDTFEEIESYREVLLSSLEETFCAPMEEFVRLEVKRVRRMKQDVQKASGDLEASLVKYLRQRHGAGTGGGGAQDPPDQWDTQLSVLRQSFELTRYDMLVELNSQKTNRKFQLCQRVCTALYAHLGYFQECHGVIAAVEPALDQLNTELSLARKEFSSKGMLYNLKRKLLLREVKRASPALALLLPKRKRGSFQSDIVAAPQQPFSSYAPSSLLPNLGLDAARRPSLEGSTMRRPSVETAAARRPSADAVMSLSKLWAAAPAGDNEAGAGAGAPRDGRKVAWEDDRPAEAAASEDPAAADAAAGPGAEGSDRPPLFGQVGEIEGLRMSQYLGSRAYSSGEFDESAEATPTSQMEGGHVRARSSSSEPKGTRLDRVNSNAGEIITTGAVSPPRATRVSSDAVFGDEEDARPSRHRSVSVHSIYSDASRANKKSSVRWQGYLWKQSNNMARDWHRRWFIIDNGHLWYMQTDPGNSKALIGSGIVGNAIAASVASRDPAAHGRLVQAVERKLVCSLLISTVKELKGASEFRFCWQVISPGKRVYVLQAESLESYNMWVKALRTEIEVSLSKVQTHGAHSSQVAGQNSLSPNVGLPREMSDEQDVGDGADQCTIVLSEGQQDALRRINRACADCGRAGPEWASVNNGIMLCIECCGVHRSLGTHVSKVRSLRLDRWTPNSVQLLVEIGNKRFNAIFERNLSPEAKPSENSSRAEITTFINAKYIERKYVGSPMNNEQAGAELIAAAGEGNIVGMVEALGAGADVNARTADAYLLSALHCACRGGHALAVELLCQMNASVDIVDALGKSPSDYIDNDNVAVIDTLYSNVESELNSYSHVDAADEEP